MTDATTTHRGSWLLGAFVALTSPFASSTAKAASFYGRAALGGMLSQERYVEENPGGTKSNDFSTMSGRLFLDVSRMSSHDLRVVMDLRDKHDLFGSVNGSAGALESKNTFQVRQLKLVYPGANGNFSASLGRFQAFESGPLFVDGLEAAYRIAKRVKTGLFAGLNPRLETSKHLDLVSQGTAAGVFVSYLSEPVGWYNHIQSTTAVINQTAPEISEEERIAIFGGSEPYLRTYLFHSTVAQIGRKTRLVGVGHVDVQPRFNLQRIFASGDRKFTKKLSGLLALSHLNPKAYRRARDPFETLEASSYQEAMSRLRFRLSRKVLTQLRIRYGKRASDGLTRAEMALGARFARFLSPALASDILVGYRDRFTKSGPFWRLGVERYFGPYEVRLSYDGALEKNDDGEDLAPTIVDLSAGAAWSRRYFASLGVQHASDARVSINSIFFRIATVMGNRKLSPTRRRAPLVGGSQ